MATVTAEDEPITAAAAERAALNRIDDLLTREQQRHQRPALVGSDGERIPLPESLVRLLRQAVPTLIEDQTVTIMAVNQELTTQQAADLLNVSRPYLIKLLDAGEIPVGRVGTHRRVRVGDLLAFKRRRDAERRQALARLTRLSREFGLDDA
jgi:excisionase family DNA binding protein